MSATPPPLPPDEGGLSHLPPDLQQQVRGDLGQGERVLWAARPASAGGVGCAGVLGGVFGLAGLLLLAFALSRHHAGGFGRVGGVLMSIVFLAAGGVLLYTPHLLRRRSLGTVYVVSDRRAFICSPSHWVAASFLPQQLAGMSVTEKADGSGDLVFGRYGRSVGGSSSTTYVGFFGVARVREVEALIRRTLLPQA